MTSTDSTRHGWERFQIPIAVVVGVVAAAAFPATYSDPTVFSRSWQDVFADVFGNIGAQGAAGPAVACIALIGWALVSISRFGMLGRTGQIAASIIGALVALSVVWPPYGVGPAGTYTADNSIPVLVSDIGYTPAAVAPADATGQYYGYLLLRWIGIAPICVLSAALVLWLGLRFAGDTTAMSLDVETSERVFSDAFMNRIRSAGDGFRHVARFGRWLFSRLSLARCAIMTVVMLVPWSVWLWLMAPSNIAADTVAQIMWYRTGEAWDPARRVMLPGYAMSDHHP
ncbi:hypothetical protein G1C97_1384 [Bifidobacterium sp. DSM 109959]|uniref:Uncharacterized protein n=1 Tax=Bifidobacterium olomucense TaxID=2675324 RepID=A0A7Y0HXL8_9BIFI|nr:hypothetical protein [Bifidobacterium sp. DSM 109959]